MSKKIAYKHRAELKDGELFMSNKLLWEKELDGINNGAVFLTIQADEGEITLQHHKYYRGIVLPIVIKNEEFGGWEKDYLHAFLKHELGEKKSTKNMTTKEMHSFVEKVKDYLAINHNIIIPERKDYHET